jgi:DNA-binding transcriptional LysR family regulator
VKVNLKLLQTFLIAAEKQSFRKAADETSRSPSAVTMQMRDLEAQVGIPLFLRTPGHVTLTREGRLLLKQVRLAMVEIHNGLELISDAAASRKDLIAIACSPTLASTRLPNILATFKARFPKTHLSLQEVTTADALPLLREQDIEFFLGPEIADLADFQFVPIIVDPLYACVPAGLDDSSNAMTLADLTPLPLILLARPTAIRGTVDMIAEAEGLRFNIQYEVRDAITALALAAAGLGVAILPRIATLHSIASQLRLVRISHEQASRKVGIFTLMGSSQSYLTK